MDQSEEAIELRRSVQSAVMDICGNEEESGSTMTATAIEALAELTFLYATTSLANDLDAFSTHGARRTINFDDVKLTARKNADVTRKLAEFCEEINGKPKARRVTTSGEKQRTSLDSRALESSDDSDMEPEKELKVAKPPANKNESKKRARPIGSKRLGIDSDSSSDDSEAEKRLAAPKKKAAVLKPIDSTSSTDESEAEKRLNVPKKKASVVKPIELDDSSTSSEESSARGNKKMNSHLLKVLAGSLSFSDDENSFD